MIRINYHMKEDRRIRVLDWDKISVLQKVQSDLV